MLLPPLPFITLPVLILEDGALAEPVSVTPAAVPLADCPGVGAGVGALGSEGPGLDTDGAGAEAVPPPPLVGARGTTGRLPGVVPGDDGGTGTSLCMCTIAAYRYRRCIEAKQPYDHVSHVCEHRTWGSLSLCLWGDRGVSTMLLF